MSASELSASASYRPRTWVEIGPVRVPAHFGAVGEEYRAARERLAVVDRGERGLLCVTGQDRATWLHNLVTNTVTTLDLHRGNYAFAVDTKGRTIFDLNIFVLQEELWLDVPREMVGPALAHLERFLIAEDVDMYDATQQYMRIGVTGPEAAACAQRHGAGQLVAMPDLGISSFGGDGWLFKHDFAGLPGFELIIERDHAPEVWTQLVSGDGAVPCGYEAIDALRIEAAIPWFGRDIDDQVIPPETRQVERGISYNKGCYLGQEIIARMHARDALARQLVRLRIDDGIGIDEQMPLTKDGRNVGRLTSLCKHPVEAGWIGLGYLKTGVEPTGVVVGEPPRPVEIHG